MGKELRTEEERRGECSENGGGKMVVIREKASPLAGNQTTTTRTD